jgi:sigma-B regulation protein RsbU (phosphoserine phosphatase)
LATWRALETSAARPQHPRERARFKELEQKLEILQRDHAELNTAIFEAAQVYRRLCAPRLVRHGDFEIASEVFAVRHLPGDFFTVEHKGRELVLALGDIAGKGLAAGMWGTNLVGLIRNHTSISTDPRMIVAGVNRDFCRLSSIAPLTSLFVATLDTWTGKLTFCNAGHPPALLLRANGELQPLSDGGPVLGVMPTAPYESATVDLQGSDLLLICSDGVLESFNLEDQEFGRERLESELRRAQGGSTESVLYSVLGAVQDFAAPRALADDMTLAIIGNTTRERRAT